MAQLGEQPGAALDASFDGSVIVGTSRPLGDPAAFRWTSDDGVVLLGDLPGGRALSSAFGVSYDGSVVVGRGETDAGDEAFIGDRRNGMRSLQGVLTQEFHLDLAGWQLSEATDVAADGRVIVGTGVNPLGDDEAWRVEIPATPIPLPGAAWMALPVLGGSALVGKIRKLQRVA